MKSKHISGGCSAWEEFGRERIIEFKNCVVTGKGIHVVRCFLDVKTFNAPNEKESNETIIGCLLVRTACEAVRDSAG